MPFFQFVRNVLGQFTRPFRRRRAAPPAPDCYIYTYICEWYDPQTGFSFGSREEKVTLTGPQSYSRAAAAARAKAIAHPPACVERMISNGHNIRLRCRLDIVIPCP